MSKFIEMARSGFQQYIRQAKTSTLLLFYDDDSGAAMISDILKSAQLQREDIAEGDVTVLIQDVFDELDRRIPVPVE